MLEKIEFEKHELNFKILPGVFSHHGLDVGSQILLKYLENMEIVPKRILDLGCGCGLFGICLAKKFPNSEVYLTDADIRAVRNTRENIKINKTKNAQVTISDWIDNLPKGIEFDLIVSNPPTHQGKEVIEKFINDSFQAMKTGATMMLVMNRMTSILKHLKAKFGDENVEKLAKKKGYLIIRITK